jgi:serine/threonine protein kinase
MAPEVMLNRNHGFAADYFALGVIAYECMVGKRPYRGKHKNSIRDKMMGEQVVAVIQEPYEDYPPEAADFINKCILKDPKQRISKLQDVKDHPWFRDFDWAALINGTMIPLYMPSRNQT